MAKVTVHGETKGQREQPNPQQPITQSPQRGAQTTSAHLHWCGADPPSSWPAHIAGNKGDPPKRGFGHFRGLFFIIDPQERVLNYCFQIDL